MLPLKLEYVFRLSVIVSKDSSFLAMYYYIRNRFGRNTKGKKCAREKRKLKKTFNCWNAQLWIVLLEKIRVMLELKFATRMIQMMRLFFNQYISCLLRDQTIECYQYLDRMQHWWRMNSYRGCASKKWENDRGTD